MKGGVGPTKRRQGRLAAITKHEVFVGDRRFCERQPLGREHAPAGIQLVDHLRGDPLDRPPAGVEPVEALHLVGGVVLGPEAERLGLHPQVRVFGDQDHRPRGLLLLERERGPQDAVVGRVLEKRLVEPLLGRPAEHDADRAEALAKRAASGGEHVAGQGVDPAEKLAGLEVDVFVAPLELVEFLEHRDRDRDVVFLEIPDAAAVVEDHVRVEHEQFGADRRHPGLHAD